MVRVLTVVGVMVGLLLIPASALAAKPSVEMEGYSFSDLEESLCDFPVLVEGTVAYRVASHVDRDGNLVKAITRFETNLVMTNLENGNSIALRGPTGVNYDAATATVTVNDDGTITYRASASGKMLHLIAPGLGVIALQAGQLEVSTTFTADGDFVDEVVVVTAGRETFDAEALCGAMS